ncbi:ABC-type nitrate/sulfonate/bicarbonate transport system, ATPase component [Sanguibacter keddieii DSM 10542]|uniref:ABC-type nitrate/sulfonate/bicarbonate transport system, ATPase component n=1 Tax=Sanguibacter keddieii (strain ATCC 51767 / DSM 10542 / NCFB 3025 / ST-74) TaxID=446469 RepID=D1BIY9_SANKS|nr:ABC transporter ATP-binding protein [Sanguibacter keddieii]ACZ20181.1 ABC-type nitrate/sulfonate/bicarbonate transport system, ATPase component [Sanguibacter keddieii DSM 10542]
MSAEAVSSDALAGAALAPHVVADPDHIVVRGLHKTYPGTSVAALSDVELVVPRGTFVSLIGPSGCGKSTLLRAVAGLEGFDDGSITIFGATPEEACAAKSVGLVPQAPALLPWLTVRQNVELPHKVNRRADRRRAERERKHPALSAVSAPGASSGLDAFADVDSLLDMVNLTDAADKHPGALSGGMQQRVAIARAFGLRPEILLMDEPFSALDEFTREALRLQLLTLWQRMRTTVLFVTHSVREAVTLSDQVVVMSARPGQVHEVIDVDLPRPRGADVLLSPQLHTIEDRVRASLQSAWEAGAAPVDLVAG